MLTIETIKIGGRYHWKCDPATKLVYLGHNWSGNGYWHQFAKVESPTEVWCEILTNQLSQLEETKDVSHYKRMGPMGLIAMTMAVAGPEAVANLFPEPKPEKVLTDEDKRRIQAAEERRKRRNAKAAQREVG